MRWPVVLFSACASVMPGPAHAQADFAETTIAAGQEVRVTEPSGRWLQGVVTDVTPTTLSVAGRVFQPEAGLKVERVGDSVWNGAAIGFGIGALLGGSMNRTGCFSNKGPGCVVKPGLVFGGIAALIDRAIVGRRTVFVGQSAKVTRLSIDWPSRLVLVSLSF